MYYILKKKNEKKKRSKYASVCRAPEEWFHEYSETIDSHGALFVRSCLCSKQDM